MEDTDAVIATFKDHSLAEGAVKELITAGFDLKKLSIVGKAYHAEEKIMGFYNIGDRVKFWGTRGAFWGGFWGLLFGGMFMVTPFGHVVVLGYLATMAVGAIENAALVGGFSALAAAFYSLGLPEDSILKYESDIKADGFLVMAHGTANEMTRAKEILGTASPLRIDVHTGRQEEDPVECRIRAAGSRDY